MGARVPEGKQLLLEHIEVEVMLKMPEVISGKANTRVLCRGSIVRSSLATEDTALMAIAVAGYSIVREPK
jgi:hypothetical protein